MLVAGERFVDIEDQFGNISALPEGLTSEVFSGSIDLTGNQIQGYLPATFSDGTAVDSIVDLSDNPLWSCYSGTDIYAPSYDLSSADCSDDTDFKILHVEPFVLNPFAEEVVEFNLSCKLIVLCIVSKGHQFMGPVRRVPMFSYGTHCQGRPERARSLWMKITPSEAGSRHSRS